MSSYDIAIPIHSTIKIRINAQHILRAHIQPLFPSYRNQSVDLQKKSTDWFYKMRKLVVKRLISTRVLIRI